MKLSHILEGCGGCELYGSPDTEVTGIACDSRQVQPGFIFVALPGHRNDGKDFIPQALSAGAVVIAADARVPSATAPAWIVANDPLAALASLSARFYGRPDRDLLMVGVTGTNGKTTITYFLESILNSAGLPAGVIGTINYRYAGKVFPAPNTTPQSADVYRMLRDMAANSRKAAVMEVSSHALMLQRVSGIEFDIAVFTNLTRDHLDFHQTMDEYFQAKSRLFTGLGPGEKTYPKCAIINADDTWGRKLAGMVSGAAVVTYGIEEKASVRAEHLRLSSKGAEFTLCTPSGNRKAHLPHLGRHNVYNALAAAAAALSADVSLETVVAGLEHAPMVPGRLEKVDAGQPFTVVVDFAHTDDALRNVLTALRQLAPARLITVFGCGGDRDRSKRPLMGEAATELSDYVFVTSDNPRSEDPQRITLDIEVGIRRQHRDNYQVLLDREQAIAAAVTMAHKGDIILIAGKGHETYQIIGTQKNHFNDAEVAHTYLTKNAR